MSARDTSRTNLTRWLIGRTRTLLLPLAGAVVARIVNQLLGVALLVLAATTIVHAAAGEPLDLPVLIAWLVGIALVKALLRYLEHFAGHWVAFAALQRLRELLFARLIPQAPAATQGRAGAELTTRATRDIDRIEVFFAHTLPPAVSAVVVPAVALLWLGIAVDPLPAWVLAPFVVAVLLVPLAAGSATWRAAQRVAAARGTVAAHLGDNIQGVREVLALDAAASRLHGLDDADGELAAARAASGRVQALRSAAMTLLELGALLALVAATMNVTMTDAMGAAGGVGAPLMTLATGLAVAIGLWAPTRGIDDFATGLDAAFAAAERVRAVVEAEPAVRDTDAPGAEPADAGVELSDVTLRYPGATVPALQTVSARFEPGAWSYLVGVSGSGKSTVGTLLLRGLDPDAGVVRLGGVDVRGMRLDGLRGRVGLVSQRPTLLSGTIEGTLRLAAPEADAARLREALHIAALDTWVDGLPKGLRTPVRERGVSLSGGQLQRLALARALVAAPDVLVLDEALSQLDGPTAALVRERLREHRPGLTVIEVTHRADLVPDEAAVVVLDAGRLVQSGPAGALRAADGPFTRLEARV